MRTRSCRSSATTVRDGTRTPLTTTWRAEGARAAAGAAATATVTRRSAVIRILFAKTPQRPRFFPHSVATVHLSATEIDELLRSRLVGWIGCHADGLPYVVPVIYAYEEDALYVVSIEGRKVRMMRANPQVCF